jgi:hypothetical protein
MKTKQQKQLERRKKYERQRNLRHCQPSAKYVLQVKEFNGWKTAKYFYSWEAVEKYEANTEDLRRRNAAEIVEAVIIDVKSGKPIKKIEPHHLTDPALLGAISGRSGPARIETEKPVEAETKVTMETGLTGKQG